MRPLWLQVSLWSVCWHQAGPLSLSHWPAELVGGESAAPLGIHARARGPQSTQPLGLKDSTAECGLISAGGFGEGGGTREKVRGHTALGVFWGRS